MSYFNLAYSIDKVNKMCYDLFINELLGGFYIEKHRQTKKLYIKEIKQTLLFFKKT